MTPPYIVIQARMTSTRLPGKVMLPLCGRTVLEVMLRRLERFWPHLVVATTNTGAESLIVALCQKLGVACFQGPEEDVLCRYHDVATFLGAKAHEPVVRLTSDCPLVDAEILAQALERFEEGRYDYLSTVITRTYPRGLDLEIMRFATLQKAHMQATTPFEREHVTPFVHTTHKSAFRIGEMRAREDHSRFRLTLDEEADYLLIQAVYAGFGCRLDFTYAELIGFLEAHPEIVALNGHVEQKKV